MKEMIDVVKKMSILEVAEGSQSRTQEVETLTEISITTGAEVGHRQSTAETVIVVENCLRLLPTHDQIARRMFATTTLLLGWILILNHRELIVVVVLVLCLMVFAWLLVV